MSTRIVNAAGTDFELDVKYEMIKPIGHGAYGVVISAINHENDTKVGETTDCILIHDECLASRVLAFGLLNISNPLSIWRVS